jgi:hypothetical protein
MVAALVEKFKDASVLVDSFIKEHAVDVLRQAKPYFKTPVASVLHMEVELRNRKLIAQDKKPDKMDLESKVISIRSGEDRPWAEDALIPYQVANAISYLDVCLCSI